METFDSATQRGLFNTPAERTLEHAADAFLSGLSRAFTLSDPLHYVRRIGTPDRATSSAVFHANGRSYRVTVEELARPVLDN